MNPLETRLHRKLLPLSLGQNLVLSLTLRLQLYEPIKHLLHHFFERAILQPELLPALRVVRGVLSTLGPQLPRRAPRNPLGTCTLRVSLPDKVIDLLRGVGAGRDEVPSVRRFFLFLETWGRISGKSTENQVGKWIAYNREDVREGDVPNVDPERDGSCALGLSAEDAVHHCGGGAELRQAGHFVLRRSPDLPASEYECHRKSIDESEEGRQTRTMGGQSVVSLKLGFSWSMNCHAACSASVFEA